MRNRKPACCNPIVPASEKYYGLSRHFFQKTHYLPIFQIQNNYYTTLSGHSSGICGGKKCLRGHFEHFVVYARQCPADVINFLNEHFDDPVIALDYLTHAGSGMDLPSCSSDMNPCDFFLWGHLKDDAYRHNPEAIEQLEQYICSACETIGSETFEWVSAHFV